MPCRPCDKERKAMRDRLGDTRTEPIYMDYNATTPVRHEVLAAYEESCRLFWGNPGSPHKRGRDAWERLQIDIKDLAVNLEDEPENLSFFPSGTAALQSAIRRCASAGHALITTATEHRALLNPVKEALQNGGEGAILNVDEKGKASPEALAYLLDGYRKRSKPVLTMFSAVNHETGAVQPIRELAETARRFGSRLLVDAVQALPRRALDQWRPWCEAYAFSGHKIGAPKGCALLSLPDDWPGEASEAGTADTPGIAALARAVSLLREEFPDEEQRLRVLTNEGEEILRRKGILFQRNSPEDSPPGILNISLASEEHPSPSITEIMQILAEEGFCLSRFAACTLSASGPSPILTAMGIDKQRASRSFRISLGKKSKRDDFFRLAAALARFTQAEGNSTI